MVFRKGEGETYFLHFFGRKNWKPLSHFFSVTKSRKYFFAKIVKGFWKKHSIIDVWEGPKCSPEGYLWTDTA